VVDEIILNLVYLHQLPTFQMLGVQIADISNVRSTNTSDIKKRKIQI